MLRLLLAGTVLVVLFLSPYSAAAKEAEEVVIYLVEGEVDHVDDSGRREALTAGSVAVLTAHEEISHDMEMLKGKRARWLSVVVRLPWHTEPPPTTIQIKTAGDATEESDGTVQKPVVGPLARAGSMRH